jgi:hypothetical protein
MILINHSRFVQETFQRGFWINYKFILLCWCLGTINLPKLIWCVWAFGPGIAQSVQLLGCVGQPMSHGSIPIRDKRFSSHLWRPDRKWNPTSLPAIAYWKKFPRGFSGCFTKLITRLHLQPGLRMRGAVPLHSICLTCFHRKNFTLSSCKGFKLKVYLTRSSINILSYVSWISVY